MSLPLPMDISNGPMGNVYKNLLTGKYKHDNLFMLYLVSFIMHDWRPLGITLKHQHESTTAQGTFAGYVALSLDITIVLSSKQELKEVISFSFFKSVRDNESGSIGILKDSGLRSNILRRLPFA